MPMLAKKSHFRPVLIVAAATLLITTVTIVIVGYAVWVARSTRKREREVAAALRS